MRTKIRHSVWYFLLLIVMNSMLSLFLIVNYHNKNLYDTESVLQFFESRITSTFENLFFHTQLAEVLARIGYENFSREEMSVLLAPVIEGPGILNVSFLPNGVVEYVFPLEGNEEAIGDDIFAMSGRKKEAQLAMELREAILCGPYALTQGGTGFIMRKAIFVPNEQGGEDFWGMVAVVADAATVFLDMDLKQVEQMGYTYELSTDMIGQEKQIVAQSDHFLNRNAVCSYITLPNGYWRLCISKGVDISQAVTVLLVFSFGMLLSTARYKDLRKKEQEFEVIQNEVFLDNLTGLYNRKRLSTIEVQLTQTALPYTVFYIDLNDFKQVNDTYGHEIGDRLLVAVSSRFKKMIRADDLAIRIGGDEFVLLLLNVEDEETIRAFSQRLENLQKELLQFGELEMFPSLSYGHAAFPQDGRSLDEVLQCADQRMYYNKKQGKTNREEETK